MTPILIDLGAALALYHGSLTFGATTYPAVEARFTVVHQQAPSVQAEIAVVAPVGKAEPVSLRGSLDLILWRF